MAGFFASGTSAVLKRLCRYALNKIDLFEDSALDFDQHEIRLGVFQFNDLAIKVEKLEKYITLPPGVVIDAARVRHFNFTIPSDFYYSSSCIVDISGVEVKAKVLATDLIAKEAQVRGTQAAGAVPSAADLAQSFIDVQSSQQRQELESMLVVDHADTAASTTLSETSSEGGSVYGTGQGFSLPAFLTNFINGCLDRAKVLIKDVALSLDVDLPSEDGASDTSSVTIKGTIAKVSSDGGSTVPEKRSLAVEEVRIALISEARVFATLSRSPSGLSSAESSSPTSSDKSAVSREATFCSQELQTQSPPRSQGHQSDDLGDSEAAFDIPYDLDDPPYDAPQEDDGQSSRSTPRASVYHEYGVFSQPQPPPVQNRTPSPAFLPSEAPGTVRSGRHTPPDIRELEQSLIASSSSEEEYQEQAVEDLAESRVYSHADAESMYQSAFSHAATTQGQSVMPGGWASSPPRPQQTSRPLEHVAPAADVADERHEVAGSEAAKARSSVQPVSRIASPALGSKTEQAVEPTTEYSARAETLDSVQVSEQDERRSNVRAPTQQPHQIVEIVQLESITASLPLMASSTAIASQPVRRELGRSHAQVVPGAFSTHLSQTVNVDEIHDAPPEPEVTPDASIDMTLTNLRFEVDTTIVALLIRLTQRILSLSRQPKNASKPQGKVSKMEKQVAASDSVMTFSMKRGSVLFYDDLLKAQGVDLDQNPRVDIPATGLLLKLELDDLVCRVSPSETSTAIATTLGRLVFGFNDSAIISFDRRAQMRASIRDVIPEADSDIAIGVSLTSSTTRCEVTTLPLLLRVDLPRLEQTFRSFGGFGGFLKMGSSMASSFAPAATPPKKPAKRGVRFETPIEPDDRSAKAENKVDMRVGGLRVDLVGSDCAMSFTTTAVKMVSREEGIGIGISQVQLLGPFLLNQRGETPINVVLDNSRLEYLFLPKDQDLDRLLGLIVPSKGQFDDKDDNIMVDTLLKQRRKGSVLRLTVERADVKVGMLPRLQVLYGLGEELARLSSLAKLPEDDRPGLLTLSLVRNLDVKVDIGGKIGSLRIGLKNAEVAQITLPSLVAVALGSIDVRRNMTEELVHSMSSVRAGQGTQVPELTLRIIGDELEPVIKVRLQGVGVEYRVHMIMDLLGLGDDSTPQDFEAGLAASIADLGGRAHHAINSKVPSPRASPSMRDPTLRKATVVDVTFRDCAIGLNPLGQTSKMLFILSDAQMEAGIPKNENGSGLLHLKKASILLIDDVSLLQSTTLPPPRPSHRGSDPVRPTSLMADLCEQGYANICQISSARVTVEVTANIDGKRHVDVEVRDDLFVLETCADSTQTLIALANALKPPTPPSKEIKYKTEVVPINDMLASITADAFGTAEGEYDFDQDFGGDNEFARQLSGASQDSLGGEDDDLEAGSRYFDQSGDMSEHLFDAAASSLLPEGEPATQTDLFSADLGSELVQKSGNAPLQIRESYYGEAGASLHGGAVHWDSANDTYAQTSGIKHSDLPLRVRLRDVHVIWNLFDGYDWQRTRDAITKTVHQVETRAHERQMKLAEDEAPSEDVIGDFLFNSIYIGIPANHDPRELAHNINQEIDRRSETESLAPTTVTATTARAAGAYRSRGKKLRLTRSRRSKITFELQGIDVELLSFAPGSGETDSAIDVKVRDLVVYDRVPTSTWKKFAAYDQDKGPREMGESMVHLELLNVRPLPEFAASEIVLKATVLPLRLHVDQDALDFITRFFEFKDDAVLTHNSPSDVPFIQRAEVMSIPVKLDFKPKRVDYGGLRSGHTTEFMNFLVLDTSRLTLRHAILYGVSGFDRLGQTLNDIWMPDVKKHQLPSVLAGVAPVRSLVNVGSGFRDLINIPIQEYKKDGRIVRSVGKGAFAFAQTTGTELVKLGAKLAVGTQYVLQGAEELLSNNPDQQQYATGYSPNLTAWDPDADPEHHGDALNTSEHLDLAEAREAQISLYANQPTNVMQGLRHAYASLARDLRYTRDAVIAVPSEIRDSETATGAAAVMLRRAPTIVFRPAMGVTKAVGQTLMGATNALDRENLRRAQDKYKSGPARR